MTSTIKVNNIQNQCGANIINESSNTITIGASGDTIALASGASQTGFGRTGTVDWDTTPKTATFSAVSGDGFFCNTTSGAFTCNLTAGAAGAIVSLADYAGTWDSNNLTVSPNGSDKIGGNNANVVLNTEGQSVTFVYVDSTQGWLNVQDSTSNERAEAFMVATGGTITTSGNFKIHTFTGPGTFCVSQVASTPANNEVSYLVVAGGGGGGSAAPVWTASGGGGAGGYREKKSSIDSYTASPTAGGCAMTLTASPFPITVGAGGNGAPASPGFQKGSCGTNSVFNGITSAGGGGGATYATPPGSAGGSGGGGGDFPHPANPTQSGNGNTPSVSPSQGNGGGNGAGQPQSSNVAGGGGGGIAGGGSNASAASGGAGGNGLASSITASPVTRAGGGGGGPGGSAGSGGGGAGGPTGGPGLTAPLGTANTGGGGGGIGSTGSGNPPGNAGGNGGSGIVIIRYKFQ